jgi:hypothetical protein
MRARAVRSQIYLPVLRFGITDQDWAYVLLAGSLGYSVPFLLGLQLYGIPLELWVGIIASLFSVAALNMVRVGRRPQWLKHVIQGMLKGEIARRRLPGEASPPWLTLPPNH